MTRILIVPDKFKGSISASGVADSLEKALRRHTVGGHRAEIEKMPMADGGDGSMSVIETAIGGKRIEVETYDALMRPITAQILLVDGGKTAFIESAGIIGLAMLSAEERNPEKTTSYGFGLAMAKAAEMGCEKIVVGIGGTATNDGGEGMLRAWAERKGGNPQILVACDVENTLLGPEGATMVYGPQKGADREMLQRLERRMEMFAAEVGLDVNLPGGGAAGGLGAALHKIGGRLEAGWRLFGEMTGLEEKIAAADTVITGEGRFDSQSFSGKLIDGITTLCAKYGKKPVVVCGHSGLERKIWKKAGVGDVFSLSEMESDIDRCISDAESLLSGEVTVVGCDEAGRGCLAGPVFAAAVVLPEDFDHPLLNDSKQLSPAQRESLRPIIEKEALSWAVASCDNNEIDRMNILNASIEAMHRALEKTGVKRGRSIILVDGNKFKAYKDIPCHTVVKGDAKIRAIAAASILAKCYKDEYMSNLAKQYPQYGWEKNAAYPTPEHREAIRKYGITPYHRRSYALLPEDDKTLF